MITIGKYTITRDDERNLKLTETVVKQKGDNAGQEGESFIGYYGYLDQCLNKIVNLEAMKAVSDSEVVITVKELRDAILRTYDSIKEQCHIPAMEL